MVSTCTCCISACIVALRAAAPLVIESGRQFVHNGYKANLLLSLSLSPHSHCTLDGEVKCTEVQCPGTSRHTDLCRLLVYMYTRYCISTVCIRFAVYENRLYRLNLTPPHPPPQQTRNCSTLALLSEPTWPVSVYTTAPSTGTVPTPRSVATMGVVTRVNLLFPFPMSVSLNLRVVLRRPRFPATPWSVKGVGLVLTRLTPATRERSVVRTSVPVLSALVWLDSNHASLPERYRYMYVTVCYTYWVQCCKRMCISHWHYHYRVS